MSEKQYIIISVKHTDSGSGMFTLWGSDFAGYTTDMNNAGVYTREEIKAHYGEHIHFLSENETRYNIYEYADVALALDELEKAKFIERRVLTC